MFIDTTIIAGVLTVLATIGFLGGFGWIAYRDFVHDDEEQSHQQQEGKAVVRSTK